MYKFKSYIDMSNIRDSMQLDSDQVIANLEDTDTGLIAEIRVVGDVKVFVGDDSTYYEYPSEFPKWLRDLIATNSEWWCIPDVYVESNNWIELFVYKKTSEGSIFVCSDTCDEAVLGENKDSIKELLIETIKEVIKNY